MASGELTGEIPTFEYSLAADEIEKLNKLIEAELKKQECELSARVNLAEIAGDIMGLDVCIDDGLDAVRLEILHICATAVMGFKTNPERRHCLLVHKPNIA